MSLGNLQGVDADQRQQDEQEESEKQQQEETAEGETSEENRNKENVVEENLPLNIKKESGEHSSIALSNSCEVKMELMEESIGGIDSPELGNENGDSDSAKKPKRSRRRKSDVGLRKSDEDVTQLLENSINWEEEFEQQSNLRSRKIRRKVNSNNNLASSEVSPNNSGSPSSLLSVCLFYLLYYSLY